MDECFYLCSSEENFLSYRNIEDEIKAYTSEFHKLCTEGRTNTKDNIDVYRKLTIAHGDITIMLDQHKLEMQLCTASHWRKMVGIKTGRGITRAMLKPKDIEKAKELFPKFANDIKNNDDKADAILIGYGYYLERASRDELEYNWE